MSHSTSLSPVPDSQASDHGNLCIMPTTPTATAHGPPDLLPTAPHTPPQRKQSRLVTSRDIGRSLNSRLRGRTASSVTRELYGQEYYAPSNYGEDFHPSSPSPPGNHSSPGSLFGGPAPGPDFRSMWEVKLEEENTRLQAQVAMLKDNNSSLSAANSQLRQDSNKTERALKKANLKIGVLEGCQDRLVRKTALLDAALSQALYQRDVVRNLALYQTDRADALHHIHYRLPFPLHRAIETFLRSVPDLNTGEDIETILLSSYSDYNLSMSDTSDDDEDATSDN